ncbi:phosphoribosylanthranilate isomerase [Camelimonas sp. ID_303_24]
MTFLVKICGLRDAETLDAALAAGANMVGFVHFARSPRHLDLADAARLVARARERQAQSVVLAVDPDDDAVARIVEEVKPDWLQLHGAETPERVAEIQAAHDVGLIKAIGVSGPEDVARALTYDAADLLLLDARPPRDATRPGGNGVAFDWALAGDARLPPFLLSGGLHPDNVAGAIAGLAGQASLAGVDVSSGVENAPGVKDAALVGAFIRAAVGAALSRPSMKEPVA